MPSSHQASGADLTGRVALVTGADRGIGKALADGLEMAGARVWRHAKAAEDWGAAPGDRRLVADLESESGPYALADDIARCEQGLDILVNNAGIERPMSVEDFDGDRFNETIAVNSRAPVLLVHKLLPLLKTSRTASVINVTSIHEDVPYPGNIAYVMSKAALAMFTKTAAIELGPYGIRVNNLAPGAVTTDINREIIAEIGVETFASWIPLGRVAEVEDMIGPLLFLASDASRYVTGLTLVADGGYGRNVVRY